MHTCISAKLWKRTNNGHGGTHTFQNLLWIWLMVALSAWKALARISLAMGGSDLKTVLGTRTTPGFWLLNAEIDTAFVEPTFFWKWTSPTGKMNKSPFWRTLLMSLLSGFDVTKPTWMVHSKTARILEARGCMWGGTTPSGAKSIWANEMPSVLESG